VILSSTKQLLISILARTGANGIVLHEQTNLSIMQLYKKK